MYVLFSRNHFAVLLCCSNPQNSKNLKTSKPFASCPYAASYTYLCELKQLIAQTNPAAN